MKEYFGELSVIGMKGCDKFVRRVDEYLCQWRKGEKDTYLVEADCPRFGTGEAKGCAVTIRLYMLIRSITA